MPGIIGPPSAAPRSLSDAKAFDSDAYQSFFHSIVGIPGNIAIGVGEGRIGVSPNSRASSRHSPDAL
jgi:hypothetical protein